MVHLFKYFLPVPLEQLQQQGLLKLILQWLQFKQPWTACGLCHQVKSISWQTESVHAFLSIGFSEKKSFPLATPASTAVPFKGLD